ncbi:hypothetical protein GCM10025859_66210 [Alicyclobacillus fastidiosus]|nr:hypothetical protein GCM10025859_64010 [Alicyclobacillus fastidiosus]GMA66179.1 hypothetical protein GCM10025859_66210 [Alicyclobacillus fastidiosus]
MDSLNLSNMIDSAVKTYVNETSSMPQIVWIYYVSQIVAAIITILGFIAIWYQLEKQVKRH